MAFCDRPSTVCCQPPAAPSPLYPQLPVAPCSCIRASRSHPPAFLASRPAWLPLSLHPLATHLTLQLWEGFETTNANILVLGATNKKERLDDAVLRRFSLQYEARAACSDGWMCVAAVGDHRQGFGEMRCMRRRLCRTTRVVVAAVYCWPDGVCQACSLDGMHHYLLNSNALQDLVLHCWLVVHHSTPSCQLTAAGGHPTVPTVQTNDPATVTTAPQVHLPNAQQREAILRLTLRRHAMETGPRMVERELWPLIFRDAAVSGGRPWLCVHGAGLWPLMYGETAARDGQPGC